jgi:hypothetical protein
MDELLIENLTRICLEANFEKERQKARARNYNHNPEKRE